MDIGYFSSSIPIYKFYDNYVYKEDLHYNFNLSILDSLKIAQFIKLILNYD
jgi:hypothetical protein